VEADITIASWLFAAKINFKQSSELFGVMQKYQTACTKVELLVHVKHWPDEPDSESNLSKASTGSLRLERAKYLLLLGATLLQIVVKA